MISALLLLGLHHSCALLLQWHQDPSMPRQPIHSAEARTPYFMTCFKHLFRPPTFPRRIAISHCPQATRTWNTSLRTLGRGSTRRSICTNVAEQIEPIRVQPCNVNANSRTTFLWNDARAREQRASQNLRIFERDTSTPRFEFNLS